MSQRNTGRRAGLREQARGAGDVGWNYDDIDLACRAAADKASDVWEPEVERLEAENERLNAFVDAVGVAFQPHYFNGIEVDGKTKDDVLDEIGEALDALMVASESAPTEAKK